MEQLITEYLGAQSQILGMLAALAFFIDKHVRESRRSIIGADGEHLEVASVLDRVRAFYVLPEGRGIIVLLFLIERALILIGAPAILFFFYRSWSFNQNVGFEQFFLESGAILVIAPTIILAVCISV